MTTDRHYSEQEINAILEQADHFYPNVAGAIRQVRAERDETRAAVQTLREALVWYSRKGRFDSNRNTYDLPTASDYQMDGGQRARDALAATVLKEKA